LQFNSYFNAKLLLTAEYLVLNGAKALAIPLRFGQCFQVTENRKGFISWQSFAHDGAEWFSGRYTLNDFSIIESSNPEIAEHPRRLMQASRELNSGFCTLSAGCHISSALNYPLLWGLGSSSTLIAAIAAWANVDPFQLHFKVSKGSGYDIACALSPGPIIYSLRENRPEFVPVTFSPSFADKIYFVYQGNKQDSAEGIKKFQKKNSQPDQKSIDAVGMLTDRMLNANSLFEFEEVIREHEALISGHIDAPAIKQTLFSDLPGEVKSLGAWGGDFCMLTWRDDPGLLSSYLKSKGLEIGFNFNDIVL